MTGHELPEMVKYYASQLSGDRADDAWHSLVELGPAALPHVVSAFEAQSERLVATALIRVASEYRTKEGLPFFVTLLGATDGEIWKIALDGIVAMGDESAVPVLRNASQTLGNEKRPWVEEAISQINEGAGKPMNPTPLRGALVASLPRRGLSASRYAAEPRACPNPSAG